MPYTEAAIAAVEMALGRLYLISDYRQQALDAGIPHAMVLGNTTPIITIAADRARCDMTRDFRRGARQHAMAHESPLSTAAGYYASRMMREGPCCHAIAAGIFSARAETPMTLIYRAAIIGLFCWRSGAPTSFYRLWTTPCRDLSNAR